MSSLLRGAHVLHFYFNIQTHPMFLDGHVCEVNKHVVQFTSARCVLDCAEPAEAKLVPEDQTT